MSDSQTKAICAALVVFATATGCTLRLETVPVKTEAEVEKETTADHNHRLVEHCEKLCAPYLTMEFLPIDQRCICSAREKGHL